LLPRTPIAVSLLLVSLQAFAIDSNIDTVRTGNTIAHLEDRDYSVPRLSPSGHRVAFAHNPRDLSEVPEVLILDLSTSITDTLLDRRSATINGIFGVAVIEIEWLDEATVEIALTDGDVDITYATIFVDEPRVLDSHEVFGPTFEFPPERENALEVLTKLHRDWDCHQGYRALSP